MIDLLVSALTSPVLRGALVMSLLASVCCGVMGAYVVTQRISYVAGAVAHAVLAGIGAVHFLRAYLGIDWLPPLAGAFAVAILAALAIGYVEDAAKERSDTIIGAVWASGMAIGVLFIYNTPGYSQDLMSYLFGSILLVSGRELALVALLDAVILGVVIWRYSELLGMSFDPQFAALRNVPVQTLRYMLLILVALTTVMVAMMVGIVLVIALLTLPAAIATRFAPSYGWAMAGAVALCAVFMTSGLVASYPLDWPPGPVIICIAAAAYAAALLSAALHRRLQRRAVSQSGS